MKHATAAILFMLLVASRPGLASDEVEASSPPAQKARECFQRALALYDAHDLDGAEGEFRRAYELAPNYRLLYNLGQIASERQDYATALVFFRRYLADGGDQIPDERRQAVSIEMAKLGAKVGNLGILYTGPSAEVLVDDQVVGRTPLASPIIVNVGLHRVKLRSPEGLSPTRAMEAKAGDLMVIDFQTPGPLGVPNAEVSRPVPTTIAVNDDHRPGQRMAWIATGVCALATIAAGIVAYNYAHDLRDLRQRFPVTRDELDSQQRKTRYATWTTDGLAATTIVLAAVSVGLGLGPHRGGATSVTLTWPGVLNLRGAF